MNGITIHILGYNDMFSPDGWENLIFLDIKHKGENKILAIEAPCHITKSIAKLPHSETEIPGRKIDAVLVTHPDEDHKSGIGTLMFVKKYADKEKLTLIALPDTASAVWEGFSSSAKVSRENGKTKTGFDNYVNLIELQFGKRTELPQFGVQIESFWRSTRHAEYLFGSLAFRILKNKIPILAYSGDTAFDPELISFLAKDEGYPIIHEVGSYSPKSSSHTSIEEILTLPRRIQERIYLNHIPRTLENKIREKIEKANSPIRMAYELK